MEEDGVAANTRRWVYSEGCSEALIETILLAESLVAVVEEKRDAFWNRTGP